jgi:cellulose synthase/poly-beta-1,6-N-acetylglucosamine synthase-like glycosyltransferase
MQLREAYATFLREAGDVACLQAPLTVDQLGHDRLLGRLFSLEYAALFDGLLPTLAELRLPLPLGGTSNHFRREALEAVGGWDPFNVTEDADLGLRLARFGYRTSTIDLPTFEEAPPTLRVWVNQRTRWFKGWLQTWLVHTRRPLKAVRQLGVRGVVGFNLTATGLVVSSLVHPAYLITLTVVLLDPWLLYGGGGVVAATVVCLNLFNLAAGYASVVFLTCRALELRRRPLRQAWVLLLLPVYWVLMSFACYRAVIQLVRRPHFWDKTPHRGRGASRFRLRTAA